MKEMKMKEEKLLPDAALMPDRLVASSQTTFPF
jgi:hypothetical protein